MSERPIIRPDHIRIKIIGSNLNDMKIIDAETGAPIEWISKISFTLDTAGGGFPLVTFEAYPEAVDIGPVVAERNRG